MKTQLNKGMQKRVMYVESKGEPFDGAHAHIGWVTFSKTGQTVYYKGKTLKKSKRCVAGNFFDDADGTEFWISGVKKKGSNVHWSTSMQVKIDTDAMDEYKNIRGEL